jgi:hypothetical protein
MTLGKMRQNGVRNLIGYCLNDSCRHSALIDVSGYPDDLEVRWFQQRAKCAKCGGKRVDVRPSRKEKPGLPDDWQGRSAWDE